MSQRVVVQFKNKVVPISNLFIKLKVAYSGKTVLMVYYIYLYFPDILQYKLSLKSLSLDIHKLI